MRSIPTSLRRVIFFALSLTPILWLALKTLMQQLGADPAKAIVLFTGTWTIYFLFITLSVTPARRLFGWNWLATHRRMLGLFALFYALLHLAAYVTFILGLDFGRFFSELVKRPYIIVGMPAVLILVLLGVTSTKAMMQRLGKHWIKIHRLTYLAVVLAWVHVFWQVRASYQDAIVYGVIIFTLLGIRAYWYQKKSAKK
jgi:sulfoxide reductase heme-binding subunit YedZ